MSYLEQARDLIKQAGNISVEQLPSAAVDLSALILKEANETLKTYEKKRQKQLKSMVDSKGSKAFALMMTDQCFRSTQWNRIANQLGYLISTWGYPKFLPCSHTLGLKLLRLSQGLLNPFIIPLMQKMLRKEMSDVILPGEKSELFAHLAKRFQNKVRVNFNYLGEAVLGEEEAQARLNYYIKMLQRPEIDYVSVKISSIYSQLNLLSREKTLEVLSNKLSQLYRIAKRSLAIDIYGNKYSKFVNLDMEEFRDVELTMDLFKLVLNESEFKEYQAGIVLQAYLPDSYSFQKDLTQWAKKRLLRGGSPVKLRLVKGANLSMEQVESSVMGWSQAPFLDKKSVDANFKQMLHYAMLKENAESVHLGVGSHNLFDISYALLLREKNQVKEWVSFEMLEGMAPHLQRAIHQISGEMLLYCPVAREEDFSNAMAYLFRRLDESTSEENFLKSSFFLTEGSKDWEQQRDLFLKSFDSIEQLETSSRRQQNRFSDVEFEIPEKFKNDPDTDFSVRQNCLWAEECVNKWKKKKIDPVPLVVNGKEQLLLDSPGIGINPSCPEKIFYYYSCATLDNVETSLQAAKNYEKVWQDVSMREKVHLLHHLAHLLRKKRQDLIGAIVMDTGKIVEEADSEISEAIDFAEYYAFCLKKLYECPEVDLTPKGTVLVLSPWNFPVAILCGGVIGALAMGNCVIAKPAREAVLCGYEVIKIFWEAGFPKQALQFIAGDENVIGDPLVTDRRVDAVILTGSTDTARHLLKARPGLDLYAETGGKNAIIVTEMADRDLAAKEAIHSAFGYSGQKCSAASLLICTEEVYNDVRFMRQLKDAAESLKVGNSWDLDTKVSPLILPPGEKLLHGFTQLEDGERWLLKPKQNPDNPHLWSPGIRTGVSLGNFCHSQELFGPVLSVMKAKNLKEAILIANSTCYGLTSGLHSLDEREKEVWLKSVQAGNYYINRSITGAIVERQPFGGCKDSNFGHGRKAGGPNYLLQFCNWKEKSIPEISINLSQIYNVLQTCSFFKEFTKEEKRIFELSLKQYTHWWRTYFSQRHDEQKLIGQDNYFFYHPYNKIFLRISPEDRAIDIYRLLAMSKICHFSLVVSEPSSSGMIKDITRLKKHLGIEFVKESEESFFARVAKEKNARLRLLSPCPTSWLSKLPLDTVICDSQLLALGRFELVHYFQERSLSQDYHRYGNLGSREDEVRSCIS
jgi:RHH-type transcriptional regulator, proline utilization regulon repressor / proline dehydrogenase / delta 1-pyrroline-5-carboxylate dehydrogenase